MISLGIVSGPGALPSERVENASSNAVLSIIVRMSRSGFAWGGGRSSKLSGMVGSSQGATGVVSGVAFLSCLVKYCCIVCLTAAASVV